MAEHPGHTAETQARGGPFSHYSGAAPAHEGKVGGGTVGLTAGLPLHGDQRLCLARQQRHLEEARHCQLSVSWLFSVSTQEPHPGGGLHVQGGGAWGGPLCGLVGLPDLANKITGCPVKSAIQGTTHYLLVLSVSHAIFGHTAPVWAGAPRPAGFRRVGHEGQERLESGACQRVWRRALHWLLPPRGAPDSFQKATDGARERQQAPGGVWTPPPAPSAPQAQLPIPFEGLTPCLPCPTAP